MDAIDDPDSPGPSSTTMAREGNGSNRGSSLRLANGSPCGRAVTRVTFQPAADKIAERTASSAACSSSPQSIRSDLRRSRSRGLMRAARALFLI
jgi:hypothetical protein